MDHTSGHLLVRVCIFTGGKKTLTVLLKSFPQTPSINARLSQIATFLPIEKLTVYGSHEHSDIFLANTDTIFRMYAPPHGIFLKSFKWNI